jgi:transcription initiation factor IIF auxiliary subunit
MRAPPTPTMMRTPPTSPLTKASSSPTSATSVSWLRMAKRRRYILEVPPKYTTSSDEGSSSDNEDDLISLFANLTMEQKKKINELIETINKKADLLECQEDLLVKENKKFVKLKNTYALEVENVIIYLRSLAFVMIQFLLELRMKI